MEPSRTDVLFTTGRGEKAINNWFFLNFCFYFMVAGFTYFSLLPEVNQFQDTIEIDRRHPEQKTLVPLHWTPALHSPSRGLVGPIDITLPPVLGERYGVITKRCRLWSQFIVLNRYYLCKNHLTQKVVVIGYFIEITRRP